jgi:nucleotide-binding universal stress UspA family protein
MTSDTDRPVIVVGVDGSKCSLEALRWAARQAEMTGAELQAVTAWSLPEIYGYVPHDFAGEALKSLETAVEQALEPNRAFLWSRKSWKGMPRKR